MKSVGYQLSRIISDDEVSVEEGRKFNLATRIMSNGVEVVIAGSSPAFRWMESNPQHTIVLSNSVSMLMPQNDLNEFITKTCTTTFTFLNTITKDGTKIVSTDQQIIANTATEERHRKPGSQSSAVTLEASPTLRTALFETTYTYLTLNAEYSNFDNALGSSRKVITNTVTVLQNYLDIILEPSEISLPQTNTYISTSSFQKTHITNGLTKIETINGIITQLIITDSATSTPQQTSVITTLTALDYTKDLTVPEILKSYYITYTYYSTNYRNNTTIRTTSRKTATEHQSLMTSLTNDQVNDTDRSSTVISSKTNVFKTTATQLTPTTSLSNEYIFFDEDNHMDAIDRISQNTTVTATEFSCFTLKKNQDNIQNESDQKSNLMTTVLDTSALPIQENLFEKKPQTSTSKPIGSLLNFSSLGINSLSALGPVITAMAGLLQGTTSFSYRNKTTAENSSTGSSNPKRVTTPRSPVYIPVAEFIDSETDKLVTAESKNIVTQITNVNSTVKTRLRVTNNLVNGIPISPGEIITANSDVIIGKPGGLAPRPPQTHKNGQNFELNDFLKSSSNVTTHSISHGLENNGGSHLGSLDFVDSLVLIPPVRPNIEKYANPNSDPGEINRIPDKYQHSWFINKSLIGSSVVPIPARIDKDIHLYNHDLKHSQINHKLKNKSSWTLDSHIQGVSNYVPSESQPLSAEVIKPIVNQVPHVIDRSIGQPLLVNIKPSQTANLVIPQGDLNALIFGDTNEQHISGEYFDEPMPHSPVQKSQFTNPFFSSNSSVYSLVSHSDDRIDAQTKNYSKNKLFNIMIRKPEFNNKSTRGQVQTEILVHQSIDNTGTFNPRPEIIQRQPIVAPLRRKYDDQKQSEKLVLPGRISSTLTFTPSFHINDDYLDQRVSKTASTLISAMNSRPNLENRLELQYSTNSDSFIAQNSAERKYRYSLQKLSPTRSFHVSNNNYENDRTYSDFYKADDSALHSNVDYPLNLSLLGVNNKKLSSIHNLQPYLSVQPQVQASFGSSFFETLNFIHKKPQPIIKKKLLNAQVEPTLFHDSIASESAENIKLYDQIDTYNDDIIAAIVTKPLTTSAFQEFGDVIKYRPTIITISGPRYENIKTNKNGVITNKQSKDNIINIVPFHGTSDDYKNNMEVTGVAVNISTLLINKFNSISGRSSILNYQTEKIDEDQLGVNKKYDTSKLGYDKIEIMQPLTFNTNSAQLQIALDNNLALSTNSLIPQWFQFKTKLFKSREKHDYSKNVNIRPAGIIHAKNDELSQIETLVNSNMLPTVPLTVIMPPILQSNLKPSMNVLKAEHGGFIGLSPPPLSMQKSQKDHLTDSTSSPKNFLKFYRSPNKLNRKKKPLTPPLLNMSMVPPPILTTRSSTIDHPSQNIVPPPLPLLPSPKIVFYSSPIEIMTVRPAIAVSGSIQIATEIARSRTSSVQDVELTIPIIHGIVNFSIVTDVSAKTSSTHIHEVKHIDTHSNKAFDANNPIKNTYFTSLLPTKVFIPAQSKVVDNFSVSSKMRLVVQPIQFSNKTLPLASKVLYSIKSLEGIYNIPSTSSINPTKTVKYYEMMHNDDKSNMNFSNLMTTKSKLDLPFHELKRLDEIGNHALNSIIPTNESLRHDTTKLMIPTQTNVRIKPKKFTHFKTLTVTQTDTSVVGSPPTTKTLSLTRTLTSTIIETVTETLLRPISIVATTSSEITVISSNATKRTSNKILPTDTIDSIFIVMSDQNLPATSGETIEAEYDHEEKILSRDEQELSDEFHRIITEDELSAALIPYGTTIIKCYPECQHFKMEMCLSGQISSRNVEAQCVCRPGFARMFPGRLCEPTYSYTLHIELERTTYESHTHDAGLNKSVPTVSTDYKHITKDSLDRTLMQSGLRDTYQGLNIVGFNPNLIEVELRVQFTEKTDEIRLEEMFKKNLVSRNISLGGTQLHDTTNFKRIKVMDFDECLTIEGGPYHDCSPQANCFNRRGFYECSCKEGWRDISENSLYPGRLCSQLLTGCSSCSNYGHCLSNSYGKKICECFPWHFGQRCQFNLKVLLIALVTTGVILLIFLGVCLVVNSFRSGYDKTECADQRAMITSNNDNEDALSNTSVVNSALPHHVSYILPQLHPSKDFRTLKNTDASTSKIRGKNRVCSGLDVKIPRAKYTTGSQFLQNPVEQAPRIFASDKITSSKYIKNELPKQCISSQTTGWYDNNCDNGEFDRATYALNNGALVSAGFQVSATVARFIENGSMIDMRTIEPSTIQTHRSSADSKDNTHVRERLWDLSSSQTMTGSSPLNQNNKDPTNRSYINMSVNQLSPSSKDTLNAQDSTSEGPITADRDLASTLRLQHAFSHDTNLTSDRESTFDSL